MKALLLVPVGLALVVTGVAAGVHLAGGSAEPDAPPAAATESEVTVRNVYGETRVLSASEAADRIERLEASVARMKSREAAAEAEGADAQAAAAAASDPPLPRLTRPDGKQYTEAEIRDLARTSTDPALRRAAIQALRREDTDEARAILQALLADRTSPAAVRQEAAKALATPPNRDKLPEELIAALKEETDPAVRLALVQGVGKMRDREAWMTDIVGLVHDEKDPEVRKVLFDAVVRDARDPAARDELLGIASDPAASLEERRAALAALPRGKTDAATLAKVEALLRDPDPRVRENAVAIVGSAQGLSTDTLAAALADADPGVRRAALSQGLQRLPQYANDKTIEKPVVQALVSTAVTLAASDPDPSVRRAAVQQVGNLPKPVREQVLAAGRNDPDLFVQLTAYARSPDPVAKQATPLFVGSLSSPDAAVRDFAYKQIVRLDGVTVPFDARWNAKARNAAIQRIQQELGSPGR